MKKEKLPKKEPEKTGRQGDNAIPGVNQVLVPFLCVPVKDPFEKRSPSAGRNLYRVIKLKKSGLR